MAGVKKVRAPAALPLPTYISNPAKVFLISISSTEKGLGVGVVVMDEVGDGVGVEVGVIVGVSTGSDVGVGVEVTVGVGDIAMTF